MIANGRFAATTALVFVSLGWTSCVVPPAPGPDPAQPASAQPDGAQAETTDVAATAIEAKAQATSADSPDSNLATEETPLEGALAPVQDLTGPERSRAALRNTRRWQLVHDLRDSPGWNLFETEHYLIASPVNNPLVIEGTRRRLEGLREKLEQDFPPVLGRDSGAAPVLRLLPSREAFDATGAQRGTTAHWDPTQNTLVCFDAGDDVSRAGQTWPGMQHVLVHQYLGSVLGIREPPPWLLYGLAARYEALRFEASPEGGRWLDPDPQELTQKLSEAVAAEAPVAVARLLEFNRTEFHGINEYGSGAYRNLILARAFVDFCLEAPRAEQPGTPAPKLLSLYTAALAGGSTASLALSQALGSVSLADLNQSWRDWIVRRTGRSLPMGL